MNLWLVFQWVYCESDPGWELEFQGVFDNQVQAEAACKNEYYWIGPAVLNREIPAETVAWEGQYTPVKSQQEA